MISININTKYTIKFTNNFKQDYKKNIKQGKDINKLKYVVEKLANGKELETKYKNHMLKDSRLYKNCFECHITPDWLLIYKIDKENLILLLCATDSHSELF